MTTKIEAAVAATQQFIRRLHRENFDRGLIATFGTHFCIEQEFTGCENDLHRALHGIAKKVEWSEGTRLYDSIQDVIITFGRDGDSHRPWLLIVITDGQDTHSAKYHHNPTALGHAIAQGFNADASNLVCVIAVGRPEQVDVPALRQLGDAGHFPVIRIEGMALLEEAFVRVAIQIIERTEGRVIGDGQAAWAELSRIRQAVQIPFDYAFLIDCSGSMIQGSS
jgi:hypothetical protein